MTKTIKVGIMPGRINEFAVETGATVGQALTLANLNASGYEIKVDGRTATTDSKITASTSLVLLVKKVKGNAEKVIKVGIMPGRVDELAVETGTTIAKVLELAGLNASGYEVKVDGRTATGSSKVTSSTSLVLLVKKVKGN